jgi:nitrous oxidase accessory protein NosD
MRSHLASPRSFFCAVSLVIAAAFAVPASATTVEPLDVAALHARADVVVRAKITRAEPRFVGTRIFTFYSATVGQTFAGKPGPEVVIALPGGIIGALGQRVAGVPALDVGAEYVLFLGKADGPALDARAGRAIIGLWQGVFTVDGFAKRLIPHTHDGVAAPLPFEHVVPGRVLP